MRWIKQLLHIICLLAIMLVFQSSDTSIEDTNAKVKAIFVYNFTKYIEWPANYKSGDFEIIILGNNSSLFDELSKMAQVKKAGVQTIKVSSASNIGSLGKCHIIYVSPDFSTKLSSVVGSYGSKSTLIVTEQNGLIDKGAGINFITVENKQKFELNQGALKKQSLEVSSKFLPFAHTVK